MSFWTIAGLVVLGVLVVGLVAWLLWRRTLPPKCAEIEIVDPVDHTTVSPDGAVRSIQAADITMPEDQLVEIWTPEYLERLARTYWRFLTRCTLGLIRVAYTDRERYVVLLTRPFVLLRFQAPEYELEENRGIVRWRIEKGILVSRRGRGGDGYLEIDVSRRDSDPPGCAVAHVEVEVANFYPAIASGIATWVYKVTQSKIHVIVTHGFLRSLARLDFAESRVGKYAVPAPEDTPSPRRERVS
jgi:hypothetical protein